MTLRSEETIVKTDHLDNIKLESNKTDWKQPTEWEKVIVRDSSDRRPISRVDEELKMLNTTALNNAINK